MKWPCILLGVAILAVLVFVLNALRFAVSALIREPLPCMVEKLRARDGFVTLDHISQEFIQILVTSEDPRFLRHQGFDIKTIYYAIKVNLRQLRRKEDMQGGSTITQQLVKNIYLTPKKTFTRKLTELFISLYVESKLSKSEILELYYNVIYYGKNNWGIRNAAAYFFGCAPSELTPNQSVTLVCQLPNPNLFNPVDAPAAFFKRRQECLRFLVICGTVTQETAAKMEVSKWSEGAPELQLNTLKEPAWRFGENEKV